MNARSDLGDPLLRQVSQHSEVAEEVGRSPWRTRGRTHSDDIRTRNIQIGAILAVVALYRERLHQIVRGMLGRDQVSRNLLVRLAIAFVPAALVGVRSRRRDQGATVRRLAGRRIVVGWRAVPAVVETADRQRRDRGVHDEARSDHRRCADPRTLARRQPKPTTIVAALAIGATISAAVEFSFLLGLATLCAATFYDLSKSGSTLVADYGIVTPILGTVVAFATAFVAARWLVVTLRTQPLSIFGWYRIAIAVAAAGLVGLGAI